MMAIRIQINNEPAFKHKEGRKRKTETKIQKDRKHAEQKEAITESKQMRNMIEISYIGDNL